MGNKNNLKLSVSIITLDEEQDLSRALNSVRDLADEIVVVDSGSKDKTVEIAKKFGAKVFTRAFDNYANQKNFALRQARGEWIFSIDADEEITPEASEEIKMAIESGEFDAYSMPRENIILGKFIKYTRWQPELDRHVWLWKKAKGKWVGDVHEEVAVDGRTGRLEKAKMHYQYEKVSEFVDMMNRYSKIEASERSKSGTKFSLFRLLTDPVYNFLVRYFYRLGFLDGWRGFVLSYLMAMYHFILWVKIWEKQK